jgi:nitrite reductase/ring-hydroxylating ferredoxin subunit
MTTTEFRTVATSADVREGQLLGVEVDGQPVVLGRVDGVAYAVSGLCPHQGALLAEGDLDGRVLTCPLHNGAVDICTGAPVRLPVDSPVARYTVQEADGLVMVSAQEH